MNYFAHGCRFVERPYFLAGTAVPDWLSVADRRVRVREARVATHADASGTPAAEIAAGIVRHLDDDGWFHRTPAFYDVTSRLTLLFRELLGPDDGFRCGFLGHIVAELLLDAALIAADPSRLDAYYAALEAVDPRVVEETVNRVAAKSTERLAIFIPLFRRERFLADYLDSERLLLRLNQVMRRITLKPLPPETLSVLDAGRTLVAADVERLLPPDRFLLPDPRRDEGNRR